MNEAKFLALLTIAEWVLYTLIKLVAGAFVIWGIMRLVLS